ncbi:sigma-70 family RNA polymerase sigma factor [Neptunomonas phycophila]|uniref:sigma-70 family RNA polymerase sigma factor n=1 Tax=Neptunomonas phycophila TaxID=1572645 RepID=UPI0023F805A6|nr:sigma-70 family RNA polymerase sigma factor [Neptunomonas phycophila]
MLDTRFIANDIDLGAQAVDATQSIDIYRLQVGRHGLLKAEDERQLGREINETISNLVFHLISSEAGLDKLEQLMTDYLFGYQNKDGSVSKRWAMSHEPAFIENLISSVIDLIRVTRFMNQEDSDEATNAKHNLAALLNMLSISRSYLVDLIDDDMQASPSLRKQLRRYARLRNQLVDSNLRLVFSVAAKFNSVGVPYNDLIQEGNIGLIKASDRFNFTKGYRFSTYALLTIQNNVKSAIQRKYPLISRPGYLQEKMSIIREVRNAYIQKEGRKPNLAVLSELTGIPLSQLERIESFPNFSVPINTSGASDEDLTLGIEIPDKYQNSAALYEEQQQKQQIEAALAELNPREKQVILMRYGVGYKKEFTLKEVAEQLYLSIERVRQIEKKAMRKIMNE